MTKLLQRAVVARDSVSGNDGQIDRRTDGVVYFRAKTGRMGGSRLRVYDVDLSGTKVRRVPIESDQATHRVFVQADSGRWSYAFAARERRELKASALERQLQAARYTMPDPRRGDPR